MSGRIISISAAITLWIALLTAGLFALNIGRIAPVDGAQLISEVRLCYAPECAATISLPYFSERLTEDRQVIQSLRAVVRLDTAPQRIQALYLPKVADAVTITINGETLYAPAQDRRLWSMPVLVPLPATMIAEGDTIIELSVNGPAPEGLELWPFYIGDLDILTNRHTIRLAVGRWTGQFSMGLMAVLAGALLLIWSQRRHEPHYFWLAASCLSALLFLTHYTFGISIGTYRMWTVLWGFSSAVYIVCILKFLRHLLNAPVRWLETANTLVILVGAVAALVLPAGYTYFVAITVNALSAPSALAMLVILLTRRTKLQGPDVAVFFICISVADALGVYSLTMNILPEAPRSLPLFQLMPLVMSIACLWLILSQLLRTLSGFEVLTNTLNDTLDQRTTELEQSFTRLAQAEKREAVAQERSRIMLDLHDGLGGQLVNTLAYIKGSGGGDEKVRLALEEALRDLAMMLDSVESQESLVTLLGMLRTRLEGLLADHGIAFDWQIGDEPNAPFTGPSPNLNLARIVNEAITNVIKHADATTITVATDAQSITIADNGCGIPLAAIDGQSGGYGIAGMRRRSARIGATLNIAQTASGTVVTLTFAGKSPDAA